ncbi:MAG: cation acetate symporter, partial [Bacillota bacterium]
MQQGIQVIPLIAVIILVILTVGLGFWVQKSVKSAADMYVASRSVGVSMNAAAISGEYLSAASFMGVAGMIMKTGYDNIWYPVGYATGYLFLLLFIAGPLRRFGAYTIPDFAHGRYDSPMFRKIAVIFVLCIGFFYTMPQMKGAGTALVNILNTPYWVGIVVVGTVIVFNVALGGMKGITFVQAVQYWIKMVAISLPMFIMFMFLGGYGTNMAKFANDPVGGKNLPKFTLDYTTSYKPSAPINDISFGTAIKGRFETDAQVVIAANKKLPDGVDKISPQQLMTSTLPAETKEVTLATGKKATAYIFKAGTEFVTGKPIPVTKDGQQVTTKHPVSGKDVPLTAGAKFTVTPLGSDPAVKIFYEKGQPVPNAPNDKTWIEPYGLLSSKYGHPVLYTYSLILAIVCGTAGLPHILVRFYTNPDGKTAKRTTFWVMILLGCFYVFPPMFGALGRAWVPELYSIAGGARSTDSVVLILPRLINNYIPVLGDILSAITSMGAFAGFMTTFSGLLVSLTGALAHDVYGNMINPKATPSQKMSAFRVSAVLAGTTAMVLGTMVENFDINMMVGWAFAIGAASYFPMLIVSAWWRKCTAIGAGSGMLIGGGSALAAIVSTMLADKKVIPSLGPWFAEHPIIRTLAEQPAIWAVPFSLILIFVVSMMTQQHIPKNSRWKMLV